MKPTEAEVVAAVVVLPGHGRQFLTDVLALLGLYVPCRQPMQSVLLVLFLYCPAVHAVHTKGDGPEYP